MNKKLLAGMIAVMTLSGASASVNEKEAQAGGARDARIIVEVDKSLNNLSTDEIFSSQDEVMKVISKKVTSNFKLVQRYSVLNNAFVVEVNKDDVEAIRALDEVASVTLDEIHAKQDISDGSYYSAKFVRPAAKATEDTGDVVENISAITMEKPDNTNDGEGTVIAVLDNEFFFRGVHEADAANSDDGTAWNHAVFKALPNGTAEKFTYDNLTPLFTSGKLNAKRDSSNPAKGTEGSCYFNNKVPFYFDYGGESTNYGQVGPTDHDVSSTLTYHGSHVATIAAGNADTYKGIAPKAQLACMKVFTTYIADDTGEQMGFGTSTGAYDSAILAAVEDAIALGVDGINMSLGSDLDDFDGDSLTMKTLANLANNSGILSAISAGNAGKLSYSFTGGYGNWTTEMVETGILGSYANSTDNMIIASSQPTQIYYERAFELKDSSGQAIRNVAYEDQIVNREGMDADYDENDQHWMTDLLAGQPADTTEFDWVYIPGFGTESDYPAESVQGKIVVVNRGSTSFADKYSIASKKKAAAIVIVNNDPTATDFNFRCSFGEGFDPDIPCALALYKDKPTFENAGSGKFKFIEKRVADNDLKNTISTYSSDGARFDYSLKPDITTPGENIRGAVPPQKKEHRDESPYSTYEYLSGTSMAAPNYAGSQSLVLSKVTKDIYSQYAAGGAPTAEELATIKDFRKTVDLRLMSTADPMVDSTVNPEDPTKGLETSGELAGKSYTSPRMQGAGRVNLDKAYNTDIYLDGLNKSGKRINKSKIQLFNEADIASGTLNLKFAAINETTQDETYTAKVTVMRPATTKNNKVLSAKYKNVGEIDDETKIPGLTYVEDYFDGKKSSTRLTTVSDAGYNKNDVIKLTKQIKYYDELQIDGSTGQPYTKKEAYDEAKYIVLEPGYYYNASETGCEWKVLPDYEYQSVQDLVIDTFTQSVTIPGKADASDPAKETTITLNPYTLSEQVKSEIMSKFPYGCAIEGYVELQQTNETKLSIPYLGFFSNLDDSHPENTLENAPVVEPFAFEKDDSTIYPSDLVNDVTKQLVGKSSVDFGSSWTVGYADTTMDVDTDDILVNEASFNSMSGFHKVGVDPVDGKSYFENPGDNIYVGSPEKTNTMIIHQFVLRSVEDNFFEIKNSDGEIVYKSVLTDMLFGDKQLYKSHVDANYLGAGYVAHRASAIIPLYDTETGKAFESGKYTITFNYQLAYNSKWVNKSYNFYIDSKTPEVTDIKEYKDASGTSRVRIEVSDMKVCDAIIGFEKAEFEYDETKKVYFLDVEKEYLLQVMEDMNNADSSTEVGDQRRLFLTFVDAAFGKTNVIIHYFNDSFNNYVMAQGSNLSANMDFVKNGNEVKFYEIGWDTFTTEVNPNGLVTIKTSFDQSQFVKEVEEEKKSGCGGSITAASLIATTATLSAAGLVSLKKRKEDEEDK
ncbi:MAG: S8 family serine peptidase [Bacilli bacterium]|nr:S8 family serine peptidase [Bacilli bacterium]